MTDCVHIQQLIALHLILMLVSYNRTASTDILSTVGYRWIRDSWNDRLLMINYQMHIAKGKRMEVKLT